MNTHTSKSTFRALSVDGPERRGVVPPGGGGGCGPAKVRVASEERQTTGARVHPTRRVRHHRRAPPRRAPQGCRAGHRNEMPRRGQAMRERDGARGLARRGSRAQGARALHVR